MTVSRREWSLSDCLKRRPFLLAIIGSMQRTMSHGLVERNSNPVMREGIASRSMPPGMCRPASRFLPSAIFVSRHSGKLLRSLIDQ